MIVKNFPIVQLGKVLRQRSEFVEIDDFTDYKRCRVQWYGQGIIERDIVPGIEIKTKKQQICLTEEFLVAEIDAKLGGFGIVPDNLDGTIVSGHYFLFVLNKTHLDPSFLKFFIRTSAFMEQVRAQGTTNYAAIRPGDVLEYEIPLPPLSEQRRIVARIEELAARIEEARGLRRGAEEKLRALIASSNDVVFKLQPGWIVSYIRDFCDHPQYGYTESATNEPVGPRFLRITDIQNGRVQWNNVPFCRCPNPEQYLLKENDLVFARTGATTGKSFLIQDCPEAIFASYLIRLRVRRLVTADYLYHYFQTPSYWVQITDEKKGTGQPNVNGTKLANIRVPIPPPEEQKRIVAYLEDLQEKIDSLKRLQAETSVELDALLPSILDKAFKGEL